MRFSSLALGVLTFAAAGVATAQTDPRGAARPVVILVHGRGMLDRDTAATRKLWLDGLTSGAATITRSPLLQESDVRVAWYADVLDPRSSAGCDYSADDPRTRRDSRSDAGFKQFVSMAGGVLNMLSGLSSDKEATSEIRGLAADANFLSDVRKRCASESRLDTELDRARREGRPIILVAHSLGSLVVYDDLSARRDTGLVQRLVTIGSPLGSPDLRHMLIGGDSTDELVKPPAVRDWVNIRNEHDQLATQVPIARDLMATPPADEPDPHEMVGYLRGTATAKEILSAWCSAFSANRPQGCKDVIPK